ncbi:hypothetical protein ALP39_200033 [Pseudomonas marginalis pv. marginalis]|nr:hypothetical protein ALP39_200033 [Pseudomonas marginalis pv. marginalis]
MFMMERSLCPQHPGNFGREQHIGHTERYRRAAEHLDVLQGLWNCYEDDAFVRDKASDVFLDPQRQHRLDHHGEFFSVTGPLNIARAPGAAGAGESAYGGTECGGLRITTISSGPVVSGSR